MGTVPVFIDHNDMVHQQRFAVTNTYPVGTLTGGDKKDVIISGRIYTNFANTDVSNPVVIYGWHYLDGSHIQNVYNGHEETYADYSHGIRLVQMNATLNGQPNTFTNIVKNPAIAGVLSDDPYYTNNVIPTPRYRGFLPVSPIITMQPASQSVRSNATVSLKAFAIGDSTLSYQWKRNGVNVGGATNAMLTLTNVTAANAGTYTLAVTNSVGFTNSIPAVLTVGNPTNPTIFADNFETNSSANWNVVWSSTTNIADYTVDWAYDYSGAGYVWNGAGYFIPPAPNSGGTTRGVKVTVNNNDTNAAIIGVNLYPKNKTFSSDYSLKFDMWMNYPGGTGGINSTGSTQHAIFGLNHRGTNANWAATSASVTDGLWFAVDGEGGVSADYRAFVGNPSGAQTELIGTSSGLSQSNSTASIYQTLFPSTRFETAGSPGKNWVQVEVRQVGNLITWLMDGTVVAERNNTPSFTSGTVMIGYMDVFPSIANPSNQAFVIFDNVRVENLSQTLQSPSINSAPSNQQCYIGTNVTLTVNASGTAPLYYSWLFNGVPINGATNASLQLSNVQLTNSGTYSVIVTNEAGATSANANLTVSVAPAFLHSFSRSVDGQISLTIDGSSGQNYWLEASTNLLTWDPISTLTISNGTRQFTDFAATNMRSRFYRARFEQ